MRGFHSVRPSHRSFLLTVFHILFALLDFFCVSFFFLYLLRFPFHINFLNCSLQSYFLFYDFRLILFLFHFLLFIPFFHLHLYFSFLLISLVFPCLSFLHDIIFRINSSCASLPPAQDLFPSDFIFLSYSYISV